MPKCVKCKNTDRYSVYRKYANASYGDGFDNLTLDDGIIDGSVFDEDDFLQVVLEDETNTEPVLRKKPGLTSEIGTN